MTTHYATQDAWGQENKADNHCPMCGATRDGEHTDTHQDGHSASAAIRRIANLFRDDPTATAILLIRCSDNGIDLPLEKCAEIVSSMMLYCDNLLNGRCGTITRAAVQQRFEKLVEDLFRDSKWKHALLSRGADHEHRRSQ